MNRVLVIGLDGSTFDLIGPWITNGNLPNFKKILDEGTYGVLKSVIPTNSLAAWTSFYLGKTPGKHGLLSFSDIVSEKNIIPNSEVIQDEVKLWDILEKNNIKIGLINAILTYPPFNVNGFMISGPMTPDKNRILYLYSYLSYL